MGDEEDWRWRTGRIYSVTPFGTETNVAVRVFFAITANVAINLAKNDMDNAGAVELQTSRHILCLIFIGR